MKSLEELEQKFVHEKQLMETYGIKQNKPVNYYMAFITKSLVLVSNIVLYPFKYASTYWLTYVYSRINDDFIDDAMNTHFSHAEVKPEDYNGDKKDIDKSMVKY